MANYNMKNAPFGNILKDGLKVSERLEVCELPKCFAVCDIDFAHKWLLDDNGNVIKKIIANITNYSPIDFFADKLEKQEFSYQFKSNIAHIVWMPTLLCNYDCLYCGCAIGCEPVYNSFNSSYPELSVEDWIYIFKERILTKFEYIDIDISGGEPFLSKALLPVLKSIVKKTSIKITTNSSFDIINLIKENDLKPYNLSTHTGVTIFLSLHPLANKTNFDTFFSKAVYLKENGFLKNVNFVAHPKQIHLIDYYKGIFDKKGIHLSILHWCGIDNEGNEGYTAEESEFLRARINSPAHLDITTLIYNDEANTKLKVVGLPDRCIPGIPFNFKLRIENSYLKNLKDKENLSLGCRVFSLSETDNRVEVGEFRKRLPEVVDNISEFESDFLIDSKNLKPGKYEFKFDIVNENKFWLEDIGFKPAIAKLDILDACYSADIRIIDYDRISLNSNSNYIFKLRVKNIGDLPWDKREKEGDGFKLGCRLINEGGKVKSEYRTELPFSVKPKDEFICEMNIYISPLELGRYKLKFDIVNENKFWFEDLSSPPFVLPIEISNSI